MDRKKLLISGLTVAGFLATSLIPKTASFAIAADDSVKQENKETGKKGSCAGGSCGAMKEKKDKEAAKTESKSGSCSGMKEKKKGDIEAEKKEGKQGSCTAMK